MSNAAQGRVEALKDELGSKYEVCNIDFEKCLYRDFGNGFNVEVSGLGRDNPDNAIIYLWFGEALPNCKVVKTLRNIARNAKALEGAIESLYQFSQDLIAKGFNSIDKLAGLQSLN